MSSDLLLRGWALSRNAIGPFQWERATAFFEQALRVDPASVRAMCELASLLINAFVIPDYPTRGDEELIARAASLVSAAAEIEPESERVISSRGLFCERRGIGRRQSLYLSA